MLASIVMSTVFLRSFRCSVHDSDACLQWVTSSTCANALVVVLSSVALGKKTTEHFDGGESKFNRLNVTRLPSEGTTCTKNESSKCARRN